MKATTTKRRKKEDPELAAAARAAARAKKKEDAQRKRTLVASQKALARIEAQRAVTSPENSELWNAAALRWAKGEELYSVCEEIFPAQDPAITAMLLQSDGRFMRLTAHYRAFAGRSDEEVRGDLECFYYALMHDEEKDLKYRLQAAAQLQKLRSLETRKVEVKVSEEMQFMREQMALAETAPAPWAKNKEIIIDI